MSSHHIVKEKQEPGMLILSLEGFNLENFGQLLEWSPTVLVADYTYHQVEALGIKIDGIITNAPDIHLQMNTLQIPMGESYLASGLHYFIEDKYPAVNVLDREFQPEKYHKFCESINLVIYSGDQKIYPVRSGFSKWKSQGEIVKIYEPMEDLTVINLYPAGKSEFRVESDGFYSLNFPQPYIFVAENF